MSSVQKFGVPVLFFTITAVHGSYFNHPSYSGLFRDNDC